MKHLTLHNIHFLKIHRDFTQRKKDEGKSASHITSVSNLSKEFLHFLESQSMTDTYKVTQKDVDAYFEHLQRRKNQRRDGGLSNGYLEKHKEAVLRFMEFVKTVAIGQSGFYIQKFETNSFPKDILTPQEVTQLFNETDNTINGIRNRAMLSLLYGCGLRKGELHKLDVSDIDVFKNTIRLHHTKTAHQRDVPLSPQVKANIEQYLYGIRELLIPENTKQTAFLLNNSGRRMSLHGIQYKIRDLALASKINKPITAHRLRHAIATHLLGDFSIEEIALFLGHRSIDSSQIYTHLKYTKS